MRGMSARAVREPGGVLLIASGMRDEDLASQLAVLYPEVISLTVLASPEQVRIVTLADELWVYGPLGLRGFLALIRRISWRHFEIVYQPMPHALPWLRFFIWPCPPWCMHAFRC